MYCFHVFTKKHTCRREGVRPPGSETPSINDNLQCIQIILQISKHFSELILSLPTYYRARLLVCLGTWPASESVAGFTTLSRQPPRKLGGRPSSFHNTLGASKAINQLTKLHQHERATLHRAKACCYR